MKDYFMLLATYNQRMNVQLADRAAQLNHEQLTTDMGAFFGSVFGTVNHIYVGDLIWLNRFKGHVTGFDSLDDTPPAPSYLDALLFSSLAEWTEARAVLDRQIEAFIAQTCEQDYGCSLAYVSMKGLHFRKSFGQLLQHFFNHQTHHRGQASVLLSQQGVDIGVTDLLMEIADVE